MSRATRFLDACQGKTVDCTPVWFMRQAGRYQASYRALRRQHSFRDLCRSPELAARVTLFPVEEFDVDAAILFSDILVLVEAMGAPVRFTDEGPVLDAPILDAAQVERLAIVDPEQDLPHVLAAVRMVRTALDGRVPLIGFAGAPLTLASYLVEGGNSKSYPRLRHLLFGNPALAHRLLDRLAQSAARLLRAQVEAGCQAVQVFDSWAGLLGPEDYRIFGLPYIQQIMNYLDNCHVPRIVFGTGTQSLLELLGQSGAEVVGIDWRTDLRDARLRLGPRVVLQGNLDPGCLFLPPEALEARVRAVLEAGAGGGHIFNLGHGILPSTDEAQVRHVVELVHRFGTPASSEALARVPA